MSGLDDAMFEESDSDACHDGQTKPANARWAFQISDIVCLTIHFTFNLLMFKPSRSGTVWIEASGSLGRHGFVGMLFLFLTKLLRLVDATRGLPPNLIETANTHTMTTEESKKVAMDAVQALFVDFDADKAKSLLTEDYIQHNTGVPTGAAPVLGFLPALKEAGIKATGHRLIAEDNLVVMHSTYENAQAFGAPTLVAFDVFRVADGRVAEHWDNLQVPGEPNASGRTMTDGTTEVTDLDKTASNKKLVSDFVQAVLINNDMSNLTGFISKDKYLQHNPKVPDGLSGLGGALEEMAKNGIFMVYKKVHLTVAEGNFVFTASEGTFGGAHTAFFDLFRLEDGLIVEHWDTITTIPEKMAHENGKF